MGEAEADHDKKEIRVAAHIVTYGEAADEASTHLIATEISMMWNAPKAVVWYKGGHYVLQFNITSECRPELSQLEVISNTNPRINYFRIEEFVQGDISYVDGVGCNTGHFKKANLYSGSTTAAHEFGHTLGLDHPRNLDLRGMGRPGIMYPRGTLVDPEFQYEPAAVPGEKGGTMHPATRTVRQEDVDLLKIDRLMRKGDRFLIGAFSSVYHWAHERQSAAGEIFSRSRDPWKRK